MSGSPSTIRVAILGGGLAGAAVLRGLLRHSHIAADMYESRPTFREEGLGVTVTGATEEVLRAIDPSLGQCLERARAVQSGNEVRLAMGPHAGQRVPINGFGSRTNKTVCRQALLDELLNGVPPRMMHPDTRLTSIQELLAGEGLLLTFADGSQKRYDVVIGADGVHGHARQHVLGVDNPASKPQHTGFWALPIKVPLEKAVEAIGPEFLDPRNPCQTSWIGDGMLMQHELLNNGKDVHIVTYGRHHDCGEGAPWARIFTPEEFENMFANNPSHVCQGIAQLIQSVYTVQVTGICLMQHTSTQPYVTKNACLVGDSAHNMLPFQGAHVTVAVEEALILSTLLGRLSSKTAIPAALQAFDQVCRPRSEQAVQSTFECGQLLTGSAPGVGLDANSLARHLHSKWDFMTATDIEAQRAAAGATMDQLLADGGWQS